MNNNFCIGNRLNTMFLSLLLLSIWTNSHAQLPTDTVTHKTDTLDELVVTARKRLFKYSANKFEYNVAADSTLENANLMRAMKRIPILEVSGDNNVSSMEGLPLIYKINGLKDPMLSGDIAQVLTALPASDISKIELKKIADEDKGTAMEVNIITKSRLEGYRAQLSTYLTDQSWRNGIWGMSKVKRFNFSGNYTNTWIYGHDMTSGLEETRTIDGKEYYFNDLSKSGPYKTDLHNIEISASYDTDETSFLSLYARGLFKTDPRQDRSMTRTVTDADGNRLLEYGFRDQTRYSDSEYEASVNWEKIFNSQTHPAYINLGYEFYNRPTRSDETGSYDMEHAADPSMIESIYDFRHVTRKGYATHTIQADGTYRINRRNEIGLFGKLRFRDETWDNDVEKIYEFNPARPVESLISNTGLKEIFGSLFPKYAHYGKRWETTLGVLMQAYRHSVSATGIDEDIKNSRISILPYARVAFITRDRLLFELNYEMKSQVPDITALDPYVNTDNAGEISYGNPNLRPQKSHDIQFRMSRDIGKFYTSGYLSYALTDDVILSRVFMSEGTLNHTFGNIGLRRSYNFGGYTSGRLFPKTFLRFSAGVSRIDYRASEINTRNTGWQWNVSARCEQELPWNLFLDANANFNSSPVMLQGRGASNFGYGLSLYKSFFSGALSVSVNASSFVPVWYKRKSTTETENYYSRSWNRTFHAYFGLGISYSFGRLQSQVKSSSVSVKNDEIKKDYDE